MNKVNIEKIMALSQRDQIMEVFKEREKQLKSIDDNGPKNNEDVELVQACVHFVVKEVFLASKT